MIVKIIKTPLNFCVFDKQSKLLDTVGRNDAARRTESRDLEHKMVGRNKGYFKASTATGKLVIDRRVKDETW